MSGRMRHGGWYAAVLVGVLTLAAQPALAEETEPEATDPVPEVACADHASTEAEAAVIAEACDQEVQVTDLLTEWDTVVAQPDGTMRLDISTGATRTRVSGEWAPIDTSIQAGPDGLAVVSPAMPMRFSDGTDGMPLATIERDGHVLSMDAPFDLPPPTVDDNQITYPQVLPGVDLIVTAHPDGTGFSEVLRVEGPEAAANPELARIDFPIQTSDGIEIEPADGYFTAVGGEGEEVFVSPVPVMWDSADDVLVPKKRGLDGLSGPSEDRTVAPQDGDTVVEMPIEVTDAAIAITPDAEVLADADTAWPVYIDPGISGNRHEWTMIQSGYPDTASRYMFTPDEGVGRCSVGYGCSRESIFRLAWEYNDMGAVGALDPSDVISATFRVFGSHSWSCTPTGVGVYRTYGISAGTTWNNYASSWGALIAGASVAHKPSCGNARWLEFDVTPLAHEMASKNLSSMVIGMAAFDEGNMANSWKRYGWDAQLSIEYNRAPVVTAMSIANPSAPCVRGADRPVIRSATPTIRATVVDPDGQNVAVNYGVYTHPGRQLLAKHATAAMGSGGSGAYTVPAGVLKHGGIYEVHSQGNDTYGRWGPGLICEFEVDLVAPNVPPVVHVEPGEAASYVEDRVNGGVGQRGRFGFTSGGITDVVGFKYSFDSDALNNQVGWDNWTPVYFTPTTAGTHRLYVQSVDRAGWTSPVKVYRFSVGFPGREGAWSFDEGTGTVAGDGTGNGNHLSVVGTDMWGPGMLADLAGVDTDHGMVVDADGEGAMIETPMIATNESFTVMAMVKPSVVDGTPRTVASQDGADTSAFTLGLRKGAGCTAASGCWTFGMPTSDSATAPRAEATANAPVAADEWVHLTAIHDAASKTVRLYTCDPLDPAQPSGAPATAPFTATWNGAGALRLGLGRTGVSTSEFYRGTIDDVRVFKGVVDEDAIWRTCHAEGAYAALR